MPYTESWLRLEEESGGRTALNGTPEELRAGWAELSKVILPAWPNPSQNVESRDEKLNGVKCRVYTPTDGKPRAIGLWTHGGGWVLGDVDMDDAINRMVCEQARVAVISIDYRLAPENKWPAQLDDCMAVYRWVHDNAFKQLNADPDRIFTFGLSAGGQLALSMADQALRDSKLKDSIKGIASLIPITVHYDNVPEKYRSRYNAYTENATDVPVLNKEGMTTFFRENAVSPDDPTCFPLLATDNHKNFPPVYFVSCEKDPLRDDAFCMEEALKEAGVLTKLDYYEGLPHYFWAFVQLPETQTYIKNLVGGIEWFLSQTRGK